MVQNDTLSGSPRKQTLFQQVTDTTKREKSEWMTQFKGLATTAHESDLGPELASQVKCLGLWVKQLRGELWTPGSCSERRAPGTLVLANVHSLWVTHRTGHKGCGSSSHPGQSPASIHLSMDKASSSARWEMSGGGAGPAHPSSHVSRSCHHSESGTQVQSQPWAYSHFVKPKCPRTRRPGDMQTPAREKGRQGHIFCLLHLNTSGCLDAVTWTLLQTLNHYKRLDWSFELTFLPWR